MFDPSLRDRARGALVGLALGDALGAPVEFDAPHTIGPRRKELFELPGGGSFDWAPGEFTDDTQMALVLARHLLKHGRQVDQDALAFDFLGWLGGARDVGAQTRTVLEAVDLGIDWRVAVSRLHPSAEGNGCLMREAPVALAARSRDEAMTLGRAQSAVTHPSPTCQDAAALYAGLLREALETGDFDVERAGQEVTTDLLKKAIYRVADARPPAMSSWVLHTLTGALWAVVAAPSFEDAVWRAVCLGKDSDTVGAIAGALAGAKWGLGGIPVRLQRKLTSRHPAFRGEYPALLIELADGLVDAP